MELIFDIKIDFSKFQPQTITKLVGKKYTAIALEKFGHHERSMTKLDNDYADKILTHWEQYTSILIKGKNRLHLSLSTSRKGLVSGGGGIDVGIKKMDAALNDLIALLNILNEDGALIFATIDSRAIHDDKHKVVTKFKSGGSSYGWEGSSDWDFLEYLPGVSWFTFFGDEYVKAIGKDKLQNLNHVTYLEKAGATSFHFDKSILETSIEDLETVEKEIGEHYFFSKSRNPEQLKHPKGFAEFLKSLETMFHEKYP